MEKNLLKDAIKCFGSMVVWEALEIVQVSDPDCAYVSFFDMGMKAHAECIEMLFFAEAN